MAPAWVAQSILHAVIASAFVELLLRVWRLRDARSRLLLRSVALVVPLAVTPVLIVAAPFRLGDRFAADWAVFSGARWNILSIEGLGVAQLTIWALTAAGLVLFLWDFVPAAVAAAGARRRSSPARPEAALLSSEIEALAERLGTEPPPVWVVDHRLATALCEGVARPRIVVSTAVLASLDRAERRAALAHELVHAVHRDPATGWVLMGVRVLLCFNPAVQLQARAIAGELERRADEEGAALCADYLALASGLVKLARAGNPALDAGPALSRTLRRFQTAAIERRCRRLLGEYPPRRAPLARTRAVLATAALTLLLFFVV